MPQRRRQQSARSSCRSASDGIVTIVAHRAEMGNGAARTSSADDRRRRARCRLGARARRAVAGRRGDLRQPGYRRLAQRAPLHPADAAVRRRGAQDAGDRPPPSDGASTPTRSRRSSTRSCTSRPASKLGYGELAADAAALPAPAPTSCSSRSRARSATSARATSRIVDLFDITTGKATYGQDVMLPGMKFAVIARPPVVGGKVASLRRQRGHEGAGRREGREDRRRTPRAGEVRSARRRRGDRQEHLGGDQGPRGAQDHLGRRAERVVRLRGLQGELEDGREASPARSSATRATSTRRSPRPPR